jgi:outer membrane autotransporter protein
MSPTAKVIISPSTAAVLSMATADPLIFKAELDTVRSRLEHVRSLSHETSLWIQYDYNHLKVDDSAGAGYGMHVNGMTLGMDKSIAAGNGVMTTGGFFSYSKSDLSFDRGGDGNVDSYSVGAYTSYLHDSGFYLDSVLKANSFGNDVHARMSSGSVASGDYNTNGIGVNLQGGKYFYIGDSYLVPYVAATGFTSNTSYYMLSNGMKAYVDAQHSVIGETGVNMGHQFKLRDAQIQPYIKLAVAQEFIDNNDVKVNEDHFTNDLSGTWGVYQVGVDARLTNNVTVHADTSYSHGSHVDAPWAASLGVSWSFK